jgi:hypothetical protein
VSALHNGRGAHAVRGPAVARVALAVGERTSARLKARPDVCRLERLVLFGACQAQGIVVGVEVWHVRGSHPTDPTKKSARPLTADKSKRPSTTSEGASWASAAARLLYRVSDFVTSL